MGPAKLLKLSLIFWLVWGITFLVSVVAVAEPILYIARDGTTLLQVDTSSAANEVEEVDQINRNFDGPIHVSDKNDPKIYFTGGSIITVADLESGNIEREYINKNLQAITYVDGDIYYIPFTRDSVRKVDSNGNDVLVKKINSLIDLCDCGKNSFSQVLLCLGDSNGHVRFLNADTGSVTLRSSNFQSDTYVAYEPQNNLVYVSYTAQDRIMSVPRGSVSAQEMPVLSSNNGLSSNRNLDVRVNAGGLVDIAFVNGSGRQEVRVAEVAGGGEGATDGGREESYIYSVSGVAYDVSFIKDAESGGSGSFSQCSDGLDNDGDGLIDFGQDPECVTAKGLNEAGCDGEDSDGDGVCNEDDSCPDDPNKQEPGTCSCGTPDTPENLSDEDGDGIPLCKDSCPDPKTDKDPSDPNGGCKEIVCPRPAPPFPDVGCECGESRDNATGLCNSPDDCVDLDCVDKCPDDPYKVEPGICGCGIPDNDSDRDGVVDCLDDCPNNASVNSGDPTQEDENTRGPHPTCGCLEPQPNGRGTKIKKKDSLDVCGEDSPLIPGLPTAIKSITFEALGDGDSVKFAVVLHKYSPVLRKLARTIAAAKSKRQRGRRRRKGDELYQENILEITTLDVGSQKSKTVKKKSRKSKFKVKAKKGNLISFKVQSKSKTSTGKTIATTQPSKPIAFIPR